jgi:hypothetical protein
VESLLTGSALVWTKVQIRTRQVRFRTACHETGRLADAQRELSQKTVRFVQERKQTAIEPVSITLAFTLVAGWFFPWSTYWPSNFSTNRIGGLARSLGRCSWAICSCPRRRSSPRTTSPRGQRTVRDLNNSGTGAARLLGFELWSPNADFDLAVPRSVRSYAGRLLPNSPLISSWARM